VVPLPEPEIRARLIAPSARGPWTLRLENEGAQWLRVPADLRLLHVTVEGGDTVSRRGRGRPVACALPAPLRLTAFPEPNALLLGPGDAYVESFDPNLFCFGKESKLLEGGAIIHATYGWEGTATRTLDAPFAVEGTVYPAAVQPKKHLVVPSLVMSWLPPESERVEAHMEHTEHMDQEEPEAPPPAPMPGQPAAPAVVSAPPGVPVDENAPRLEITASPFADAATGRSVSLTITVTNVGHRAATAAIRPRMLGYRVEGPDGPVSCPHEPRTTVPREGFQTIKPGGSTSFTLLVDEACGRELFPRPGLYRLWPALYLRDSGASLGLAAITGTLRAAQPMLIRVAEGSEPFYMRAPEALRATPAPMGNPK
jgi:hypothetical protein